MAYIAKHHIRLSNGVNVPPGQIFEADFDAKTRARLIRLGAIAEDEEEPTRNGSGAFNAEEIPVYSEDADEEIDEAEETDAPIPAPEIDALDGIEAPTAEKAAPKRKGVKKK